MGHFLSTVAQVGSVEAARILGLQQYIGQSADVLLAGIVNYLSPEGAFIEDAVARIAACETAVQLNEQYSMEESGLAALDQLTASDHATIMERYIANYIYFRIVDTLAGSIETEKPTDTVITTEQHLRDYISQLIHLEALQGHGVARLDWSSGKGAEFVERLFRDAFDMIQAAI